MRSHRVSSPIPPRPVFTRYRPGFSTRRTFGLVAASIVLFGFGILVLSVPAGRAQETATAGDSVEAAIDTSLGQIVIEFFAKDAPKHVEYFIKNAREGGYDGTTFHQLTRAGLIQGGDPLSKNPRLKARYGTGGLNAGLPDEVNPNKHITGAVSSVLQERRGGPGGVAPGTSGMQFFIVVGPQPQLDSRFTVFGRVVEGMDVVAQISNQPASSSGAAVDRIEIKKVTIRPKTPSVDDMKKLTAVFETSLGSFKAQFAPDAAPNTTRQFIRHAKSGLYDGTAFYRVSQKYYLEGGDLTGWGPDNPNRKLFHSLWPIPFEANSLKQVRGNIALRQTSGTTNWDFYIITRDNPALDGKDVPVAKVVEGLDVLDKIASVDVEGDKPKQAVEIKKITIE
jgi:cyclophilin family peptidyl-prolyl cis-trans isomerase